MRGIRYDTWVNLGISFHGMYLVGWWSFGCDLDDQVVFEMDLLVVMESMSSMSWNLWPSLYPLYVLRGHSVRGIFLAGTDPWIS